MPWECGTHDVVKRWVRGEGRASCTLARGGNRESNKRGRREIGEEGRT